MQTIIKNFLLKKHLIYLLFGCFMSYGQNAVNTSSLPSLLTNPDARSGGMGNLGVATSADPFSQFWNPSKYLLLEKHSGLAISHVPGNSENSSLSNLSYFTKGKKRGVWSGSINYFNYGEIQFTSLVGGDIVNQGSSKPSEWNVNISYNLLLSERFGLGVTAKYIHSNLEENIDGGSNINGLAFDFSGFYQGNKISVLSSDAVLRAGFSVSNLGPRIDYGDNRSKEFLPTLIRTGAGITFLKKNKDNFSFNIEANKLMVPNSVLVSPATNNSAAVYRTQDVNFISGFFKSITDAPNGLYGEFAEVGWSFGAEYVFVDQLALRAGYYSEGSKAGARKYFTLGTGFKKENFSFDLSYLMGSGDISSTLNNTLRFSLSIDLKKNVSQDDKETIENYQEIIDTGM